MGRVSRMRKALAAAAPKASPPEPPIPLLLQMDDLRLVYSVIKERLLLLEFEAVLNPMFDPAPTRAKLSLLQVNLSAQVERAIAAPRPSVDGAAEERGGNRPRAAEPQAKNIQ